MLGIVARVLACALVVPTALGAEAHEASVKSAIAAAIPASCPATLGKAGLLRNESLEVALPAQGKFIFAPGEPGFTAVRDEALGMKVGWERRLPGRLSITGRRLDADSAPLRAHIPDGYGDIGFQSTYVIFPTPGCWEITGNMGRESLTFVAWVIRVGGGPTWRMDL